jgi:hypothetical protein
VNDDRHLDSVDIVARKDTLEGIAPSGLKMSPSKLLPRNILEIWKMIRIM